MRPHIILRLAVALFVAVAGGKATHGDDSTIDNNTASDCFPRAWVRAEDLRPGREVRAEARLKVEGEGCRALERWQVGIRAKERAIFKFHAANTTLPERPVMKPDSDSDDPQDDFVPGDIFSSHRMRGSRKYEAYNREMQEYEAQLSAKSLWVSRSAIRDVFDSSLDLSLSGTEDDTYHDDTSSTYLRAFRVNIPPTNFPYTISSRSGFISYGGEKDISSVEEMFEFYFLLTFNDGAVVDIPAGRPAFVPASTEEQVEDRPFSTVSKATPDCEDGLVSDFKVDIEIPHDGRLAAGKTHLLDITIEQRGNSTEVPVAVSVAVNPCKRDTWATTYAFDEHHKAQATTCDDGFVASEGSFRSHPFHYFGWRHVESILRTESASGYHGTQEAEAGMVHTISMREVSPDRPYGSANVIDNPQRLTSLLVNLTIPDDIAFNYNRTLQSIENRLYFRINTEFTCEKVDPKPSLGAKAELIDDALWSPRWTLSSASSRHDRVKKQRNVIGNTTVEILPPAKSVWASPLPLIDYKDPAAKAIVLSTIDAPTLEDTDYPHVNTLVVESEQDLQRSKFDIWLRVPSCRKRDGKARGHCMPGSGPGLGDGLTGELWARYQWRKAQGADLQKDEEVSVPAFTAENGQVLLQ